MESRSGLRLVSFDPDDYSLGSVLVNDRQALVASDQEVGAALSLYFQWPEERTAILTVSAGADTKVVPCSLDYDRDERSPSELRLLFEDGASPPRLGGGEIVRVRFEVFRTSFEMAVTVLAVAADPAADGWHLVVEAPKSLARLKQRRLPRYNLSPAVQRAFPACSWQASDGQCHTLKVLQAGLGSLLVEGDRGVEGQGTLLMERDRFDATISRGAGDKLVVRVAFRSGEETGKFFDHYRRAAYPCLQPRLDTDPDAILALYEETKYFGKFSTLETLSDRKAALRDVWRDIAASRHVLTADYVALEDTGDLAGVSSAALAFRQGDTDYWAFHQLCARTKPDLLEASGCLYRWRAEYLAARPGPLKVLGWFDSRSRWLERIYVKFCQQRGDGKRLFPVRVQRRTFHPDSTSPSATVATAAHPYGTLRRVFLEAEGFPGAAGPRYLNASGILDAVIACLSPATETDLSALGGALAAASGEAGLTLEMTLPRDGTTAAAGYENVDDIDRFFLFDKTDLIDFLASVEHSLAITQRKLKEGRHVG